ncbi:YacL family protein [Chitinimonas sp. JJ19]|uniref:YacL family protein n=1 Tax=Chitinimonas sp. JJ19 TaxID=3109352 RepID=UPI002FFFA278
MTRPNYQFELDDTGQPHASLAGQIDQVADFLNTDIRRSSERCEEILSAIADIRQGTTPVWACTGNLYELSLSTRCAAIANVYDETIPPAELTLEELAILVRDWHSLIAG